MDLAEVVHGTGLDIGLLFIYTVEKHFLATFTPTLESLVSCSRCTRTCTCTRTQHIVALKGCAGLQEGPVRDLVDVVHSQN